MTCFASIEGLIGAVNSPDADKETNIRCVILFDNEEVSPTRTRGLVHTKLII